MHEGADASGAGTGGKVEDEQPLPCPSPASSLLAPATLDPFMLCAGLSLECEPLSPAFFSRSLMHIKPLLSCLFFH